MDNLIYNQKQIPKEQWRYGFRASAAVGCGWVATHNALRLLGCSSEPEELIRYYERLFPLIHGNTGTTALAPAVYFRKKGFKVKTFYKRSRFDEAARDADVCILFYHWRKKAKLGAHFVALQHTQQGFIGYNTFSNSTGPDRYGESLEAFMRGHRFFGAVLITISKNQ